MAAMTSMVIFFEKYDKDKRLLDCLYIRMKNLRDAGFNITTLVSLFF